jgi:hypothetical protein
VPVVLACGLCEQVLCVSVFSMQRYVFACAFLAYVKHFCSLVVLLHRWAVDPTGFIHCVVSALSSGASSNLVLVYNRTGDTCGSAGRFRGPKVKHIVAVVFLCGYWLWGTAGLQASDKLSRSLPCQVLMC